VGSEWRPGAAAMERELKGKYLEARKEELLQWIEKWRKAWEKADLENYARFYTIDAVQGSIKGIKAILANKKKVWRKVGRPQKIECKNFDIQLDKEGFLISFVQKYTSEQGYKDTGIKQLTVAPLPSGWHIISESWRKLSWPR
jgi:ketosteroid isomerase-like protein